MGSVRVRTVADWGKAALGGTWLIGATGACSAPPAPAPPRPVPVTAGSAVVPSPGRVRTTAVVATSDTSCALRSDGSLWCWGDVFDGFTGHPVRIEGIPRAVQAAVGFDHACVVTDDHELWCWGRQGHTRDMNDPKPGSPLTPWRVDGLPPVRQVDATDQVTCAVTRDERLFCWRFDRSPLHMKKLSHVSEVSLFRRGGCAMVDQRPQCWTDDEL